ncbi:HTH-type transcriptional repressor RspR [Paraconexibacter sp. AEG42_29]|uniref:HTH-type transcriptional repressor RspR n=1 Tax=Paraconexibacter sp. AEG42_29 TaxID=2997339 RepID=A0AAU7AYS8_9ACTN
MSSLQPLGSTPTTRAEAVADDLRRQILGGQIPPGTALKQNDVARAFAVSPTPVREAFARLQREGLITYEPHRGAVVFIPSVEDLRENYEIRIALEPLATRAAATRLDQDGLAALRALVDEMGRTSDAVAYFALNQRFHEQIYAAAGRPNLAKLIAELRDASAAYVRILIDGTPSSPAIAQPEHEAILAALEARAPARAAKAMADHLRHNETLMEALLSAGDAGEAA